MVWILFLPSTAPLNPSFSILYHTNCKSKRKNALVLGVMYCADCRLCEIKLDEVLLWIPCCCYISRLVLFFASPLIFFFCNYFVGRIPLGQLLEHFLALSLLANNGISSLVLTFSSFVGLYFVILLN